jgi:predicted aspartyl protease
VSDRHQLKWVADAPALRSYAPQPSRTQSRSHHWGGTRSITDIAELEVEWLGVRRAVEVIISDGDDALLGTEILDGSRLVVDYIAYIVTVSDKEG